MSDNKAEQPQADKFRELARRIGCDEDERAFEEKVRKVAKAPTAPPKPAKTAE